ncbi:GntR family transcriptional regulator [Kitasatospora sp. NPDC058190]|uniref:GntR family transcriptional regulator n=1 Tax=Kitasatospora sp. NPDC058190 TaxID=3346371 RepID=UPI0036DC081E
MDEIRDRIQRGDYVSGQKSTATELEREFGVTRVTTQKALTALRKAELIRTRYGMGSYVNAPEPGAPRRSSPAQADPDGLDSA